MALDLGEPSWGNQDSWTTAYSGAGNSTDAIPTAIRNASALAGLNTSNVTNSVQWLDVGYSAPSGNRVQVTVSTTCVPLVYDRFGSSGKR